MEQVRPRYQLSLGQIYWFDDTNDRLLLSKGIYKMSISICCITNIIHIVTSVFGTSADTNLIREDFQERDVLRSIQADEQSLLANATN